MSAIETSEQSVLAIDIGGTKVALATVQNGKVTARLQIPTPRSGHGNDIIVAIAEQARSLPRTSLAGVATTGIVDGGCLTALNPVTLPIEDRFPLVAHLERSLQRSVLAVNDAQAAAWAEHNYGAGKGVERMIFITVSTGIGAGVVLDGALQSGTHGLAGHVGHTVVDPQGHVCGCGRRGCIETVASGSAISLRATQHFERTLSAPDVFAMARAGDQTCEALLCDAAASLASVMADLVAILDFDRFILGGGVGLAEGFLERVRDAIEDQPKVFRRPVVKAEMGADAGLIGVGALAFNEKFHQ